MAGIPSANLAGSTITYNGVQFGGADSAYTSLPPQYSWTGEFVYDDAGRAVIYTRYMLTVKCVFHATSEDGVSDNVEAIKERLAAPGKQLKIEGIGAGFGTIASDLKYGPKPVDFAWQPLGQLAWECVWIVQFCVSECASQNPPPLVWLAWNFSQTWTNDFEGFCTRRISGYVEIQGKRAGGGKQVAAIADQVREQINITVPNMFKRVVNNWDESADKTRLTFVVVDQQLTGDVYPNGVTLAQGRFGFASAGPGFAKGTARLSMTLKTSPEVPRGLAGLLFIQAVLAKQGAMQQRLAGEQGTVIPRSLEIENSKWDDARITSGSCTWQVTKCLNAMLNAVGIWEPLIPGNYNTWKTSVQNLWHNRGNAGLAAIPSEDMILDICDNVSSKTFGETYSNPPAADAPGQFQLSCPPIPADGGWIAYDLRVTIRRDDEQTWHKKATSYLPPTAPSWTGQQDTSPGAPVDLGDASYNQNANDYHTNEYHGYPKTLILLQFKGLRVQHKPVVPAIRTVGGNPVVLKSRSHEVPRVAFDIFTCPAWYVAAWRLYEVNGPVNSVSAHGQKDLCSFPAVNDNY